MSALDQDAAHTAAASGTSLTEAVAAIRRRASLLPRVGVVLGSGLGAWGDALEDGMKIPYGEIPGMPAPAVAGHAGNLCLGRVGDVPVACLQGRVHVYEGHPQHRVVFGVRVLARLGCAAVLLTNARTFEAGELPADKGTELVFYCGSERCNAAPKAATRAKELGYTAVKVMPEGIRGWVRNEADGSVEVHAEGDAEALLRFERALRQGPRSARVDDVLAEPAPPTGAWDRFLIDSD